MNIQFKRKLLLHLKSQKANNGFTLIELLVVVIIIGILAAIALPNLLGQIAKGRQAEAKNNLGAVNRAQQAYRLEEMRFAQNEDDLPIKLSWQYYNGLGFEPIPDDTWSENALYYAQAKPDFQNDILDYAAGARQMVTGASIGKFSQVICQERRLNARGNGTPDFATNDAGTDVAGCDTVYSRAINK